MRGAGWPDVAVEVAGPPRRTAVKARVVAATRPAIRSGRSDCGSPYALSCAPGCCSPGEEGLGFPGEGDRVTLVMGMDQHRAQISAEWIAASELCGQPHTCSKG